MIHLGMAGIPERWHNTPVLSDELIENYASIYERLSLSAKGICFIAFCTCPHAFIDILGERRTDRRVELDRLTYPLHNLPEPPYDN